MRRSSAAPAPATVCLTCGHGGPLTPTSPTVLRCDHCRAPSPAPATPCGCRHSTPGETLHPVFFPCPDHRSRKVASTAPSPAPRVEPTLTVPALGCRECEAEHAVAGNLRIPGCHHGHIHRDHQTTPATLLAPSPAPEAASPEPEGGRRGCICACHAVRDGACDSCCKSPPAASSEPEGERFCNAESERGHHCRRAVGHAEKLHRDGHGNHWPASPPSPAPREAMLTKEDAARWYGYRNFSSPAPSPPAPGKGERG